MATYTTQRDEVLDAICFAHYGQATGTTEAVLAHNRWLADYPAQLPAGLVIELPDLVLSPEAEQQVQLWD